MMSELQLVHHRHLQIESLAHMNIYALDAHTYFGVTLDTKEPIEVTVRTNNKFLTNQDILIEFLTDTAELHKRIIAKARL